MSYLDKKNKIQSKIAANKLLVADSTADFNKKKAKALDSFNNKKGKIIGFLTDLITILVGYMLLINAIVETLTYYLSKIETEIKKGLKTELKNISSCGVNPSIPDFLKSSGTGIIIEVNKIDFFDLFMVDPNTPAGKLMYKDIYSPLTSSSDFNTFLYGVIQGDGTTYTWTKNGKNILDITFNSLGTSTRPNNTLTIKANSSYNSKKLTDLNNDFIDSLTLFNTQGIVNRILDSVYGSISFSINKSKKQLENEAKINTVIEKFIDADNNDIINDDYFTFTNDEVYGHEKEAVLRQQGIYQLETSNTINASIPVDMLTNFNDDMNIAQSISNAGQSLSSQKDVIAKHLNLMATQTTLGNIPNLPNIPKIPNLPKMPTLPGVPDNVSIKLNFTQEIFKNLTKTIISSIISPKVIMIFLINLKIVYGENAVYEDGVDFIKKNKNIFKSLIKAISTIIIKLLLKIVLKEIAKLMAKAIVKKRIEKIKNRKEQLLTLAGQKAQVLDNIAKTQI